MLSYIYDHSDVVAKFVGNLIPHVRRVGFVTGYTTIGMLNENGLLVAGLVYHNYDRDAQTVEISGAALPGVQWLTRQTIARFYGYPFLQLGCQMIYQRTPANNERLLGMLAAYNYTFVKIPRMFGRDADGVVCLLTYEDWAANRFNKRLKHHLVNPFIQTAQIEEAA